MTFDIALQALKLGKRIARTKWEHGGYFVLGMTWYNPTLDDILSDDWVILD